MNGADSEPSCQRPTTAARELFVTIREGINVTLVVLLLPGMGRWAVARLMVTQVGCRPAPRELSKCLISDMKHDVSLSPWQPASAVGMTTASVKLHSRQKP